MAYLYIDVYSDAQQVALGLPESQYRLALDASDSLTGMINSEDNRYIWLEADVDCQIARGVTPTVSEPSTFVSAKAGRCLQILRGHQIAARTPLP